MDTSKEYVKMCEKAEEIQDWVSDIIPPKPDGAHMCIEKFFLDDGGSFWVSLYLGTKIIWIPRQDQLQEILGNYYFTSRKMKFDIVKIIDREEGPMIKANYESWEQLWLVYVMKEKFGKTWNGEDWVKES